MARRLDKHFNQDDELNDTSGIIVPSQSSGGLSAAEVTAEKAARGIQLKTNAEQIENLKRLRRRNND